MTIGIGLFGYGVIAAAHAAGLRRLPDCTIQAVCGPSTQRAQAFASRHAIPFVTAEPEALLRHPQVDAVLVDTPDGSHAALTLASARHGKHIFCEKPLATTLPDATAMVEAVRCAGVRSLMGFSNRWSPTFQRMGEVIATGELGVIYHAHVQSFNTRLLGPQPPFSWRTDSTQTGSGVLADLGSHAIDLIHFLLGPIDAVCATLATRATHLSDPHTGESRTTDVDDDVSLLFRLRNGVTGTMALSRVGAVYSDFPIGHRQLLINGSAGGLAYADGEARRFRTDHTWESWPGDAPPIGTDHAEFLAQGSERIMRTFLDGIRTGRDHAPTLEDGLRCQAVLHAAVVSSRQHTWTAVPDC